MTNLFRSRHSFALACISVSILALLIPSARAQDVFVGAYGSNRIERFTSTGVSQGTFATGGLSLPFSIGFSPLNGDLFVASFLNSSVVRYDGTTGAQVQTITSNVSGSTGIAFDPLGNLLVSNITSGNITRYNGTTGAFLSTFATGLADAYYLTAGPGGDIFAAELNNNRVRRYNGTTGALMGTFANTNMVRPCGLVFGPDGNLYVSNQTANSITRYNGTTGIFTDTFSSAGFLNSPENLAFATDGTLLVANLNNSNVIAISPTGTQSIFASGINIPIGIAVRPFAVVIPEPTTFALFALGALAGSVVVRRNVRRRNTTA